MAMHPGHHGNGYAPHDMPQHMGMVSQDMNGNGYQQPMPHAMPPPHGVSMGTYQHQNVHQPMHHPQQSAPHYPPPHQQPPPQHVQHDSFDADRQLKKTADQVPHSNVEPHTNRKFRLEVLQQPERARMCGYGDKDRRPITPPPCIRVFITDATTGEEVNYNDINFSTYNLLVDLWDKDRHAECNLCRQPPSANGTAPSTPAGSFSYSIPMTGGESSQMRYAPQQSAPSREVGYAPSSQVYVPDYQQVPSGYGPATPTYPPNGSYGPPAQHFPHQPLPSQRYDPSMVYMDGSSSAVSYPSDMAKGMMSRNLIGSVVGSAHLLTEPAPSGREGIWFVLQDLSVRLEGDYCLRFTFVNVAETDPAKQHKGMIAQNRVPTLASGFSHPFKVYSAKKFPGVHESTPLSKAFAEQGVKIPIRKTGEDAKEGRNEIKDEE